MVINLFEAQCFEGSLKLDFLNMTDINEPQLSGMEMKWTKAGFAMRKFLTENNVSCYLMKID